MLKKLLGAAALVLMLAAGSAHAQTASTTPGGTGTGITTPAAPDTGLGGDATTNLLVLGTTGLLAIAGAAYLARKAAVR